jgi:lysophospholipase L1-like esterase
LNPKQILPAFNIRDHLHPNDAGYKAMAEAVDLSIFASGARKK